MVSSKHPKTSISNALGVTHKAADNSRDSSVAPSHGAQTTASSRLRVENGNSPSLTVAQPRNFGNGIISGPHTPPRTSPNSHTNTFEKVPPQVASFDAIQIYCRIKPLSIFDTKQSYVKVEENKIVTSIAHTPSGGSSYAFNDVFLPISSNVHVSKKTIAPLCEKAIWVYNALFFVYGQTGTGKSFSIHGNPEISESQPNATLPFAINYILSNTAAAGIMLSLSAVEIYDTNLTRTQYFDLLLPTNLEASTWENDTNTNQLISKLIIVDLASSEGENSFPFNFHSTPSQKNNIQKMKMEATCINNTLTQLQMTFHELTCKGKLGPTRGTGLRKLLYPYINKLTLIAIMYTISPSIQDARATDATLKFATTAGSIQLTPQRTSIHSNQKPTVMSNSHIHAPSHIQSDHIDTHQRTAEIVSIQSEPVIAPLPIQAAAADTIPTAPATGYSTNIEDIDEDAVPTAQHSVPQAPSSFICPVPACAMHFTAECTLHNHVNRHLDSHESVAITQSYFITYNRKIYPPTNPKTQHHEQIQFENVDVDVLHRGRTPSRDQLSSGTQNDSQPQFVEESKYQQDDHAIP
ncbi:hypothetical protein RFI_30086, partial [Reticulomyxa filosa]